VLRQLDREWRGCFAARAARKADPSTFVGQPRLPDYNDKHTGRNLLIYDLQAISVTGLWRGEAMPSQLGISISVRTTHTAIKQVRIVPRTGYAVVEGVYEREPQPAAVTPALYAAVTPALYAGIDLGLNTLAALPANTAGVVPRIANGRPSQVEQPVLQHAQS